MTNDTEDRPEHTKEELDGLPLEIPRIQQKHLAALEELNSSLVEISKPALSNKKSKLSSQKLDFLIKSSLSSNPNKLIESEKILVSNISIAHTEKEHEDECVDAWGCAIELNEDNHLVIDDSDGDEEARAYFPCPFCYIDIEFHVLCGHLQDEHCFDFKNAVCPLCAVSLGKDVIGHFVVHHASSLKRRRKSLKPGLWTGSSATIGRELSSFLGSPSNGRTNANEAAPDPLLSPFRDGGSHSQPEGSRRDEFFKNGAYWKGHELSSVGGGDELDTEERRNRAAFVQQLIASIIF